MNQAIAATNQFSFPPRELAQQLLRYIYDGQVGHWEIEFDRVAGRECSPLWHLTVAEGKILYSGSNPWSAQSLMDVIYRYASHTRNELVKSRFAQIRQQATERSCDPSQVLSVMQKIGMIDRDQLTKALRTRILNDLELYALAGNGTAKFSQARELLGLKLPIVGFELSGLLEESKQRQANWDKLQDRVPSMNLIPTLNRTALAKSNLPAGQQQRIEQLVASGQTLNEIAREIAKDPLEIAEMFAKLVQNGLLALVPPAKDTPPPIMVVDDSPLMLSQFQRWVEGFGYEVVICQQPELALAKIAETEPAAIFIDINMPEISGFDLVKQIRKQPQLATIPLVILTGEQGMSNRWRAQWSGCTFLTKPLESSGMVDFQSRLRELLLKLVGTPSSLSIDNNAANNHYTHYAHN